MNVLHLKDFGFSSKTLCLGFLCLVISFAHTRINAQDETANKVVSLPATTGYWQGLYIKVRISERFFYYQENHYRRLNSLDNRGDFVGRMGQVYNRPGLVFLVNPYFEITAGPVLTFRFTPEPGNDEFKKSVLDTRIWHQYLFNQKVGRVKVLHQFRIEHRWKRDNDIGAETKFTNRWRYKISAYIPLNKPKMEDKTWYFYPSNEFFFEKGGDIVNIFEENRVYNAIGYTMGNWQFFGGHMWTYGPSRSVVGEYRQRHIIRLNVMLNLDLRKEEKPAMKPLLLPY